MNDTHNRLLRLVSTHFRAGPVDHANITANFEAIRPLLRTYKAEVHEYEEYPRNSASSANSPAGR